MQMILVFGILAFLCLMVAAIVGYLARIGKLTANIKWHYYLAGAGIVFGLVHMFFAISYLTIK